MLKEAASVLCADRRECLTYYLYKSLLAAGFDLSQESIDLREGLLDSRLHHWLLSPIAVCDDIAPANHCLMNASVALVNERSALITQGGRPDCKLP